MNYSSIKTSGFTIVEAIVVMSVMTILSVVVLVGFTGLNEGGSLNRSARELALHIRRTQNMALSVAQLEIGSPPTIQIPPAVGIYMVSGQTSYILFGDLAASRDNKYTGLSEKIGQNEALIRGIQISTIKNSAGTPMAAAHIIFTAPEASVALSDQNGDTIGVGEKIEVELTNASGSIKKTITVRTSGQISIK